MPIATIPNPEKYAKRPIRADEKTLTNWLSTELNNVERAIRDTALTPTRSVDVDGLIYAGVDRFLLADATDAAVTLTLPDATVAVGLTFTVKKTDATGNAVTVDTADSALIDGAATYAFTVQYEAVTVVSDGTNWHVIGVV